jgi:hypothetical protein
MILMNIPQVRQAIAWLSRVSKPLALFGLTLLIFWLEFMTAPTQFSVKDFGLDQSWLLELGYQFQQGNLLGRDVYFTYGPLAQWIVNAGVLLQGSGSLLNSVATINLIGLMVAVVLLALSLGLIEEVSWSDALFILPAMFLLKLLAMAQMRPLALLLGMVVFVRVLGAPPPWRRWGAGLAGMIWFLGQLISAEVGLFAVVSALGFTLICFLATSLPWERWGLAQPLLPRRIYLETYAISLATFGLGYTALEVFFRFSSPTYQWFDYLRYNLDIVLRYSYAMGIAWISGLPPGEIFSFILFLVMAYTFVYSLGLVITHLRAGASHQAHLLLGILLTAGLTFKSAMVRSGLGHVLLGSTLFIFLFLLCLCSKHGKPFWQMAGRILLVLFLMAWPAGNLLNLLPALTRPGSSPVSVVEKWHQIRGTQFDPQTLASAELRAAVDPEKSIVNFPYDNVLAMALGQKSLAPILQTYAAFNENLQHKYVQEVARQQAKVEIIYGIDGLGARPIDEVQNVSRVPIIFKYLVENFQLKTGALFDGRVVLEARAQPRPLSLSPLTYEITSTPSGLDLQLSQPARCALIELELLIHYPGTALLGRPTRPVIQVWNGHTQLINNRLTAIETSRKFSTFVYLGNPESFPGLFADSGDYHLPRPFDHLRLDRPDYSLFDIYPSRIAIENLQCLQ